MCLILEEKIEENRNLKCDAEKFQNFRSDVNKIKLCSCNKKYIKFFV